MSTQTEKSERIKTLLERGVDTVYPSKAALRKRLESGRKLTVYLGADPTGADLTIGHLVVLQKLRQLQQLGHKVILLIGDFTGQTGDPTDKTATRQPLTKRQVLANAKYYQKQVGQILPLSGPNAVEVRYNSEWLGKLTFAELAELAGHFTVQQLVERDMFAERLKAGKPISLREFMYPLMQGYDSVAMRIDLEVGGSDQTFNMLAGRKLVKEYLHKEKFVITTPLLADSKGVKIGKSEGNAIAINAKPSDLYGQVMTLPDELIGDALAWCTSVPEAEVAAVRKLAKQEPRDAKMRLAQAIVAECQGTAVAERAQAEFVRLHQAGGRAKLERYQAPGKMTLVAVMKEAGLVDSTSEARRKVEEGAVTVDGSVVSDWHMTIDPADRSVVEFGKKRPRAIEVR